MPGELDPAGEQWVDYIPPLELLGSGRYEIDASYRWAATRASYSAVYLSRSLSLALVTKAIIQARSF